MHRLSWQNPHKRKCVRRVEEISGLTTTTSTPELITELDPNAYDKFKNNAAKKRYTKSLYKWPNLVERGIDFADLT